MSQQRATSNNEGPSSRAQNTSSETTDTNTSAIINLDDSEDEEADDTVEFVGIISPVSQTIDLCLSPSTSAAAAAAAASTSSTNSGDTLLKTANAEASATAVDTVLECPICLQSCIHPARLPCGHIFCFLCVKGVAYKNRRCAMCRREIPAEFLDHPQLVNGIDDICSTRATEDGYQWYYEGRNGGWWAYDLRTNEDIEQAFRAFEEYKEAPLPDTTTDANVNPNAKTASSNRIDQHDFILLNTIGISWFTQLDGDDEDDFDDMGANVASDAVDPSKLQQQICGEIYIIDFRNMVGGNMTIVPARTLKRPIRKAKSHALYL
ncbi:postreplication repair E3 ubiquitin-protein ligase RAD18 isoform X3 [Scaptodrosophila lebanonensis]|uniref:E3 ubiquitin-protein ligase n=1 Tax=Drosophila lebanonensis TaxID=7225 RepID=A0A6J2TMZ2_DROLE|nr:postreplication repair E3 ubiquitin-protein ligase RAD18 isoform X3 [Scaptodrosophila lebanonensis]